MRDASRLVKGTGHIKRQAMLPPQRMVKLILYSVECTAQFCLLVMRERKPVCRRGGMVCRVIPSPAFLGRSESGGLHGLFRPLGMGADVEGFARRVMQKSGEFAFPEGGVRGGHGERKGVGPALAVSISALTLASVNLLHLPPFRTGTGPPAMSRGRGCPDRVLPAALDLG